MISQGALSVFDSNSHTKILRHAKHAFGLLTWLAVVPACVALQGRPSARTVVTTRPSSAVH